MRTSRMIMLSAPLAVALMLSLLKHGVGFFNGLLNTEHPIRGPGSGTVRQSQIVLSPYRLKPTLKVR
jgi:hypothetical protein